MTSTISMYAGGINCSFMFYQGGTYLATLVNLTLHGQAVGTSASIYGVLMGTLDTNSQLDSTNITSTNSLSVPICVAGFIAATLNNSVALLKNITIGG